MSTKTFSRLALVSASSLIILGVMIWLTLTIRVKPAQAAEYRPAPFEIQPTEVITVYLPLILCANCSGPVTPPVTPPTNTTTITPSVGATLQSQGEDYAAALAGTGYVAGSDPIYYTEPEHLSYLNFSLIQCNYFGMVYAINRVYFEFDTTHISANSKAYISFKNIPAWPGPPAHYVNIWTGNWTQLLKDDGIPETNPAVWQQYGTMVAHVAGAWNNQTETVTIELPGTAINPGGITKLAFSSSTEGTVPQLYSCYGDKPALGGAFSIPYLLIE